MNLKISLDQEWYVEIQLEDHDRFIRDLSYVTDILQIILSFRQVRAAFWVDLDVLGMCEAYQNYVIGVVCLDKDSEISEYTGEIGR